MKLLKFIDNTFSLLFYLCFSICRFFSDFRSGATEFSISMLSALMMSLLIFLNLVLASFIIAINIKYSAFVLVFVNGFMVFYKKKYSKIIEYFDNVDDKRETSILFYGHILMFFYLISIFAFFLFYKASV